MSRLSETCWYLVALLLILALGLVNLHLPFVADQAVALLAGKSLAAGGVLYVDFWDNKMPGLFWFYWLAGSLFSFDEKGVHLLELFWMLAFAASIAYFLRKYFYHPWLSAVAALAVVGFYYATVRENQLTLPEPLATLPIFLCAVFAHRSYTAPSSMFKFAFLSGIAAGVTVTLKLIFAPICMMVWLITFFYLIRDARSSVNQVLKRFVSPLIGGGALICLLVSFIFWIDGALPNLLWTAFSYPRQALQTSPPADMSRLFTAIMFALSTYTIWLVPLGVATVWWLRSTRELFSALLLGWLLMGVGVFLIQTFSWWTYHLFLVFAPLAILGVRGIDVATHWLSTEHKIGFGAPTVTAILSLLVMSVIPITASDKTHKAVSMLVLNDRPVMQYRNNVRQEYGQIYKSAQFLNQKNALPGHVAVFGNPLYYLFSDRSPAFPIVGWPWPYFLQSQWLELPAQIESRKPVYIFIDETNEKHMNKRGGGVKELIYSRYIAANRAHDGVWFQLKKEFIEQARPK